MSLKFIYGRAGSGKSRFCLYDMKSRIEAGQKNKLVLLVPEQYSLQAEKNLVHIMENKGTLQADVLSFKRMAYRVFNEVGGITSSYLNQASKCMIIYRIIEKLKDSFEVYSLASKKQGFANEVCNLITEFKRYNVTPEDLNILRDNIKSEALKKKLTELNAVYTEYERQIKEKYRDADDDLTILAKKLDASKQFDGAEIWIDEFSGFTPQEYAVITALLKKASRVNISFCTDCLQDDKCYDCTDVFYSVKKAINKLMKIAGENGIDIEKPVILDKNDEPPYRFGNSREIAHLEKNFFAFPCGKYEEPTKDISLFSSVNVFAEIESTARDILKLCRDRGFRYRDIAVICGNLDIYESIIRAVFNEYGIAYFIDKNRDISDHPLLRMILSMFEIFTNNWSYEAVFRYLKSNLTGIDRSDIDIIENYVLAAGIRGSRWTQDEDWEYRGALPDRREEGEDSDILAKINKTRRKIIHPLIEFRKKTKGAVKNREICTALYEFLCDINVHNRLEDLINKLREQGQINLANEYSQVWNILMEVMDKIVEVSGDEKMTVDKFADIFKMALSEYKIGLIPPSLDQVIVGNLERSKSHEVKALYIIGVNDGIFPSKGSDEGLLSDSDRLSMMENGVEIASDTRSKAFEEQYMIYTALTSGSDYLRLSYSIADSEGKTMRPSIVIQRIKKIFPALKESSNIVPGRDDKDYLNFISAKIPAFNMLASQIRNSGIGTDISPLWRDTYKWFSSQDEWKIKCESIKAALGYTSNIHYMDENKARTLYGKSFRASVSRFEKYAACPFAYYMQYGLNARERKIFRLEMPDVGTFLHEVIERFSLKTANEGLSWKDLKKEWCDEQISAIADDILNKEENFILNSSKRNRKLIERLKRVLSRAVWVIVEQLKRSSFEPVGYEIDFGDNGDYPPIKIELSGGEEIYLTGRIDRLDALKSDDGTYLRIIDYKSGAKAFKLADVYYGMQIQLITYLDAIWESDNEKLQKPLLPGGMLYFKIDDPIVKGSRELKEEDIEKAIMKQLKMKGLLLADVKLIKEMDKGIEGDSLIIPARINKDGSLGRSSSATLEQFDLLRNYAKIILRKMCEDMLRGNVSIKPYKKKKMTPCVYCGYDAVCQFDLALKGNEYRILAEKSDDEIWELMRSEVVKQQKAQSSNIGTVDDSIARKEVKVNERQ